MERHSLGREKSLQILCPSKAVVIGLAICLLAFTALVRQARADDGFDADGLVTQNFGSVPSTDEPVATQLLASGKLLVLGQTTSGDGDPDLLLARFTDTGALDTTFGGGDGFVTADSEGNDDSAGGLLVQPDGKIVITGTNVNPIDYRDSSAVVYRYESDGTIDSTFGTAGRAVLEQQSGNAVVRLTNGKLLVGGSEGMDFSVTGLDQDGTIDTAFGTQGQTVTAMADEMGTTAVRSMAVQSDGKIIAVGGRESYNDSELLLVRYNSNGTLDTNFGGTGKVKTSVDGGLAVGAREVRIQSNGRIVVGGTSYSGSGDIVMARYTTAGSLDSTFGGGDGLVLVDSDDFDDLSDLLIQTDGRLLAAGKYDGNPSLLRFDSSGNLDPTFDSDGVARINGIDDSRAIAVLSDGSYLAAGDKSSEIGGSSVTLTAYTSSGTLRTAYGGDGQTETSFGQNPSDDKGWDVIEQPDGKILVSASTNAQPNGNDFLLFRFNASGTLDSTFGGDGSVTADFGAWDAAYGTAMALQSNGKIIIGGWIAGEFAMTRFNSNGSVDTSFGTNGQVKSDLSPSFSEWRQSKIRALAIQPDGKIVAVGDSRAVSQWEGDLAAARYNIDGSLDTTFGGGDGFLYEDLGGDDYASDVAIQSNGKILVAGSDGDDAVLVRYQTDGTRDSTFGNGGIATSDFSSGSEDELLAVALQSDQKIVVAGNADFDPIVARYTQGGQLDSAFDGDGKVRPGPSDTNFNGTSAKDVRIEAGGKIVIAIGRKNGSTPDQVGIARLSADGTPDSSFGGGDGFIAEDFGSDVDEVNALAIQSDGKYLMAGYNQRSSYNYGDVALLRVDPNSVPANDNFVNARALSGTGTYKGSTIGASFEASEPDYHQGSDTAGNASVWFSWTPTLRRSAKIDVCRGGASQSDKIVAVFSGSSLNQLKPVRQDFCQVYVSASAGINYKIAVIDEKRGDGSQFQLKLTTTEPPTNDDFSNAIQLAGSSPSVSGTLSGATREDAEPRHNGKDGLASFGSVWYTWTAPASGAVRIDTCDSPDEWGGSLMGFYTGSSLNSLEEVNEGAHGCRGYFQATGGVTYRIALDADPAGDDGLSFTLNLSFVSPPANDNFEDAQTLSGNSGSISGNNEGATQESGEPIHNEAGLSAFSARASVWYSWTAPADGALRLTLDGDDGAPGAVAAVYTGSNVSQLTEHGSSRKIAYATVQAGTTYKIAIDTYADSRGPFTLTYSLLTTRPANDAFANATPLSGEPASVTGDISAATAEAGEPKHGGTGASSVWYSWTAPSNGVVEIDVDSYSYPGVVSVYTGTTVSNLVEQSAGSGRIYLEVTSGTTYRIASDTGRAGERGEFTLDLALFDERPSNDNFSNATTIGALPANLTGNVTAASHEPGEPSHGGGTGKSSVWYSWTAPQSGMVSIAGCDDWFVSLYPRIGVYTGASVSNLTRITSGYCGVSFVAQAGTHYRIAFDGSDTNNRGNYAVTVKYGSATYYLTPTVWPSQSGTITSDIGGIVCSDYCDSGYTFEAGTQVTLTASPAPGYTFIGWSGDSCTGTDPCVVNMDTHQYIEAHFSEGSSLPKRTLTLSKTGAGIGTVTSLPAGINCGTECAYDFDFGTSVTLSASPGGNSTFTGWSGACSGTGTCQVLMNQVRNVEATFADGVTPPVRHELTVIRSGNGQGTVASTPSGINCGSDCSESFDHGTAVTLHATAASGSTFDGWSGACSGTNECQVTIDQARSVTATFVSTVVPPIVRRLTVTKAGTGEGTVTSSPSGIACGTDCEEDFNDGTEVLLTASPASTSTFVGWTGACSGTGTCQVSMTEAKTVSATFSSTAQPPNGSPKLKLSVSPAKTSVKAGKTGSLKIQVRNQGTAAATKVKVCLTVPKTNKRMVKVPKCKQLGTISQSKTKSTTLKLKTTRIARGTIVATVAVTADKVATKKAQIRLKVK